MLIRKARIVGSSLVITIPIQMADIYEIKAGDKMEMKAKDEGILIVKRVSL